MASAFVFYGLLFVCSLYFQRSRGDSPLVAGFALLPMTAMVAAGSIVSSCVVTSCGTRWSMCGAFGCYATGALGLLWIDQSSPYWLAVAPMVAIGLASGFISPAATAPAMGAVDKNRAGVAAAVLNSSRQTGAALGVAIFGSLIATRHPFEVGLHATLWTAAIVSMIATLIWWFIVERSPLHRAEEPCAEQENAVTRN